MMTVNDNPIIVNKDQNNYNNNDNGVIYLIAGTGGRSLYEVEEQAPFIAKQYDEQFGFINIDIYSNDVLRGTFYANEEVNVPEYYSVSSTTTNNNIIDRFILSK